MGRRRGGREGRTWEWGARDTTTAVSGRAVKSEVREVREGHAHLQRRMDKADGGSRVPGLGFFSSRRAGGISLPADRHTKAQHCSRAPRPLGAKDRHTPRRDSSTDIPDVSERPSPIEAKGRWVTRLPNVPSDLGLVCRRGRKGARLSAMPPSARQVMREPGQLGELGELRELPQLART
jgi:hypothetical protein